MGDTSLGRAVSRWAEEQPEAVAVRRGATLLTRRELDEVTNRVARGWLEAGLEPDALVALSLSDPADVVLAAVAAWKAGATPMPLPPDLTPDARQDVLGFAGPGWLVEGSLDRRPDTSPAALSDLAASCWLVTVDGDLDHPTVVRSPEPARLAPEGTAPPEGDGRAEPPGVALLHAVRRALRRGEALLDAP